MTLLKTTALVILATVTLALSADADALLLDFGPDPVKPQHQTNSPYHINESDNSGTHWNNIGTAHLSSGIVTSEGSPAPMLSVSVGRSSSLDKDTITFSGAPASAALGTQINTAKFSVGSSARDGIYFDDKVAISVSGLPAGNYDVYIVGANTNKAINSGATLGFWAMNSKSTNTINTLPLLSAPHAVSLNSNSAVWTEGQNYVKLTVTLTEAENNLIVFSKGMSSNESRGFINSIQITRSL